MTKCRCATQECQRAVRPSLTSLPAWLIRDRGRGCNHSAGTTNVRANVKYCTSYEEPAAEAGAGSRRAAVRAHGVRGGLQVHRRGVSPAGRGSLQSVFIRLAPNGNTLCAEVDSLLSLATEWGFVHLVQPDSAPIPRFVEIDSTILLAGSI